MIAIIDYGLGNVRAFANAYDRLGYPAKIAQSPGDLEGVQKIILPGVGSFDHAMNLLNNSGMFDKLYELVHQEKIPVLGICVGMQILAESSEEGEGPGLGWIKGQVRRLPASAGGRNIRVPHMGWNNVAPVSQSPLMQGLDNTSLFYFLHSYYFQAADSLMVIGQTDYHGGFTCAVAAGNVFGVQFHPEKSHSCGLRLLENFGRL